MGSGRKILILGGARFHGYRLAQYLSGNGDEVYVLNRGNYRASYPFHVHGLTVDRNDHQTLQRTLSGHHFDCVIDNNGYHPAQVANLLKLVRDRCGHYLFISSAAVYLTLASDHRLREAEAPSEPPGFFAPAVMTYAVHKRAAEQEALNFGGDLKVTIVRFPNIFGEGDFAGKLRFFHDRLRQGKKVLLEEEVKHFSLIYVEDVVRVISALLAAGGRGADIVNAADPVAHSYHDFFSSIFGDHYSTDRLVLMPARDLPAAGYSLPFAWGPLLDTSLAHRLVGDVEYTALARWGPKALQWEIDHYQPRPGAAAREHSRAAGHEPMARGRRP